MVNSTEQPVKVTAIGAKSSSTVQDRTREHRRDKPATEEAMIIFTKCPAHELKSTHQGLKLVTIDPDYRGFNFFCSCLFRWPEDSTPDYGTSWLTYSYSANKPDCIWPVLL